MKLSDIASASSTASVSIPSTTAAIAQGNALLDQATNIGDTVAQGVSSGGAYGAAASAAQALAEGLPAGAAKVAALDIVAIAEGAASGAAMGAAIGTFLFPGVGTAVVGEIGAIIGLTISSVIQLGPLLERDNWDPFEVAGDLVVDVLNIFGIDDPPPPPQNDWRYLADRVVFPGVDRSYQFGVIPGEPDQTPRTEASNDFYQIQGDANHNPLQYDFLIAWRSPKNSSVETKTKAWVLAQYYASLVSLRMGHTMQDAPTWNHTKAVLGSSQAAQAALARLFAWYGDPKSFSLTAPAHWPGGNTNIQAALTMFRVMPLDFLYYPLPVRSSGGEYIQTSLGNATDVMLTADTSLVALSEGAVLGWSDAAAFQYIFGLAALWKKFRAQDIKLFGPSFVGNHPNFSRILGLLAARLRVAKKSPALAARHANLKARAVVPPARPPLMVSASISRTAPTPGAPRPRSLWLELGEALLVAGIAAAGVSYVQKRRRRR